jgi:hypothetical protein
MTSDDPEHDRRHEWLKKVRLLHRNKRLAGLLGCIFGACLMLYGKLSPGDAPGWAIPAGLVVVALSWLTFAYVMVSRYRWVKANPYSAPEH